jgi:protein-L-isoaspartate(D-aspartate) O-methyltransferase
MPDAAPFGAIITTAAATHVPDSLLEQLKVGGRMILPMVSGSEQRLCVIERTAHGYTERKMDQVNFVPLLPGIE